MIQKKIDWKHYSRNFYGFIDENRIKGSYTRNEDVPKPGNFIAIKSFVDNCIKVCFHFADADTHEIMCVKDVHNVLQMGTEIEISTKVNVSDQS